MIVFSQYVPQPAVNPFYRDCTEIESACRIPDDIFSDSVSILL